MVENFILSGFSDEISSDIKEQFEGLKKLGMSFFEIRWVNGISVADLTLDQAKEVKKLADSYGIKASSIGSPIGKIPITDPIAPHIEKLRHVIEIAKIFETKYIRMFSFYMPEGCTDFSLYRDEVIDRLKKMVEVAKEEDIILLHENEKGIYGDIAERCSDILNAVNSDNFKAVFDPANFVQASQITYPDAYNLLKDKVVYMHIKDAVNKKVVPSGMGEGKVFEILSALKNDGYKGFLSLEPHLANFEGLAALENESDSSDVSEEEAGLRTFKIAKDALVNLINKL